MQHRYTQWTNCLCILGFIVLSIFKTYAQPTQTANDTVLPYESLFLAGTNPGYSPPFSDIELANLSAGNKALGVEGIGAKTIRPGLSEAFLEEFGYESRVSTFEHFETLGLTEQTVIVGFPSKAHRDTTFYCPNHQSEMFANLYEPIWDNGENGTPVNDNNYAALYFWKTTNLYKNQVKFWEIWNEPGFDYTFFNGFALPGQAGNWWDNDPNPCDYKLRAPIQHYVRLLRIAYEVIKTADSNAYILCGGVGYPSFLDAILRNTDNPNGGAVNAQFPLKGGAYFDAIGYHSYPHFDSSTRTYDQNTQTFNYFRHSDGAAEGITVVKNRFAPVLLNHGYGVQYPEKLWLITEINVPRIEYPTFEMGSDDLQRNFMIKAYVECVKEKFAQMHVYALNEATDIEQASFEFDVMGLYKALHHNDLYHQERNSEGIALKTCTDILPKVTFDATKTAALQLPANVGGAALKDVYGNYTYVLWAKTLTDRSEIAQANYTFPNNFIPKNLIRRAWDFGKTYQAQIVNPAESIELTATPIFFTEQAFTQSAFSACAPATINFDTGVLPNVFNANWEFSGGTANPINPHIATFTEAGNYEITLTITTLNGSIVSKSKGFVHIEAAPIANFEGDAAGGLVHFKNLSPINNNTFIWNFGDGTPNSTEANPQHIFFEDGTFVVTLTTQNACGSNIFSKTYNINAPTTSQISFTALDSVTNYNRAFRPGVIPNVVNNWSDDELADIAAGNISEQQSGAGAKTMRLLLPQYFLDYWGYDIRKNTFQHYQNLDLQENTAILGFPNADTREQYKYCETTQSILFSNLYTDIWDGGANGTPINEANPYAVYVWNTVETYRDYVGFWEIYDAADYDASGKHGYLSSGQPGNWWDFDPDPCDLNLKAPIETYIRMLRISYEIIKTLDPDSYVLLGGVAYPAFVDAILRNTDNPNDGEVHPRFPHKGGAYFDAFSFNAYPYVDGSTSVYDPNLMTIVYQRHSDAAADGVNAVRAKFQTVFNQYGFDGQQYPQKKWLITEANVPRKKMLDYFGGEEAQRNYLIKALVKAQAAGFLQLSINGLNETLPFDVAYDPNQVLGLYGFLGNIEPYQQTLLSGGKAYKTTSNVLFKTTFDQGRTNLLNLPNGIEGYAFKDLQGKFIYVLWARTSIDNSETAAKTYSFPSTLGITSLFQKNWDWSVTQTQTSINGQNIALTGTPIFLTESDLPIAFPLSAFISNINEGCPGVTVQFSDQSINAVSREWQFEGGIPSTSTEQYPSVVFNDLGFHAVSLKVTNAFGTHTATQLEAVEVLDTPEALFSFEVNGPWVRFNNETTEEIDSLRWLMHDGTVYYPWQFDKYYYENGNFEASMVVYGPCGSDTLTRIVTIQATPIANFEVQLPNQCNQFYAALQNLSLSSPTNVEWFIPGGNPSYTTILNAFVGFPGPGTYTATLVVGNEFGSDTLSKTFTILNGVYKQYNQSICEDDVFEVNGQIFNAANPSGQIIIPNGSVQGCDSIILVDLQVVFDPMTAIYDSIPNGFFVYFCGNNYTESGIYTCLLQNYLGCDSLVTLYLQVATAENAIVKKENWSVFPNPFNDEITIEWEQNSPMISDIYLVNATGQIVKYILKNNVISSGNHAMKVPLGGFPTGCYFLHFRSENGHWVNKLIKI
jgi:PKD repeat protein